MQTFFCKFFRQVARCTKIIDPGTDDAKYVINIKQIAKFVVGLGTTKNFKTKQILQKHTFLRKYFNVFKFDSMFLFFWCPGEKVAATDVEEQMRVGVDRTKYQIQIPLPPRIDASVKIQKTTTKTTKNSTKSCVL